MRKLTILVLALTLVCGSSRLAVAQAANQTVHSGTAVSSLTNAVSLFFSSVINFLFGSTAEDSSTPPTQNNAGGGDSCPFRVCQGDPDPR